MSKFILSILFALIFAGPPTAAHAVSATISIDGTPIAAAVDVSCDPGATDCTVDAPISCISPAEDGISCQTDSGDVLALLLPGAVAEATTVANVINTIKVTGLALLYTGANMPGTVEITYGNRFTLPADVWITAGNGGFKCDSKTKTASDSGNTICRNYGFTASGSFCRLDANGDCQTADGDSIGMAQSVTFENTTGTTAHEDIGTDISYSVGAGGVQNNEFFPLAKVSVPDENVACDPLIRGTCAPVETINAALTFKLNPFDAIFLSASPTGIGGTDPGTVVNRLKFAEIDIQPIYDPNNNDINLTESGTRTVAVLSKKDPSDSTKTFDPSTIVSGTVRLHVGHGSGVAPVGKPSFRDLNGDGIKDVIYTFSIPALAANGADCSGLGAGAGVAVLTATAPFTTTYQSISGKGKGGKSQTVIVTENVNFSGSQSFTCAPNAGG